ncbi:MAG: lytic transglycosylase domain-containing protein [Spirochaetota bacterium]|nr:lytic transglycosylase domain-containing protein [Spirochaetota bacterium]
MQTKTRSRIQTRFSRKTVSLFQKDSLHPFFIQILIFLLISFSAFVSPLRLHGQSFIPLNPDALLESIRADRREGSPSLFKAIAEGAISPDVLERYGSGSSFFLALHALEQGHGEAAEKMLRHAAEMENSPVRSYARQEYLELLLARGDLHGLRKESGRYLSQGDAQAGYVISHGMGLYRAGRFRELQKLMEERECIFQGPEAEGLREEYLFLRMYSLYGRGRDGWQELLLELAAGAPSGQLPDELFRDVTLRTSSNGGSDRDNARELWDAVESSGTFGEGERNLLLAKKKYRGANYISAYRDYAAFLLACADDRDLRRYCTGVVMDEYALSAVYSGNAADAARQTAALLDTVVGVTGPAPDEPGDVAFWLMETLGYLERRLGRFSAAVNHYTEALKLSPPSEEERIRWYIFDSLLRTGYAKAVEELPSHLIYWKDHSYYNDALFTLIDGLVRYERWDLIARTADILNGNIMNTAAARACYIAARAAELGLLESGEDGNGEDPIDKERIRAWLLGAVNTARGAGSGLYYRFMAAYRLEQRYGRLEPSVLDPAGFCARQDVQWSLTGNGATRSWSPVHAKTGQTPAGEGVQENALLEGFLRFGLAREAYRRYGSDSDFFHHLPFDTVRQWSDSLQEEEDYLEAIRLFNSYCLENSPELNAEDVRRLYPRAFLEIIDPLTREYELPEYIFYALVREESLFDAGISSAAGAVGLSQLMPDTAEDVAGRIGIQAEDLTDPEVNLRLGAWYLRHLIGRTGTYSQALFSYNGGINRVRRWVQSDPHLPGDMLLEKIPYAETSHYGRKVLVSSILYGSFYYSLDYGRIISLFFDDQQ